MTLGDHKKVHSIGDLQRSFDQTFAEPEQMKPSSAECFLAIRVANNPYALRLTEISGLLKDVKIVPVSTGTPEFLGIAGHRGQIIPVYDFGCILRYLPRNPPCWVTLTRTREEEQVGLAFDEYEGFLKMSRDDLVLHEGTSASGNSGDFIHDAIRMETGVRPIIAISSVIAAIKQRIRAETQTKER